MNVTRILFASIVSLLLYGNNLTGQPLMPAPGDHGRVLSLNGVWKFRYFPSAVTGADSVFYAPDFNTTQWADIKTPGCWELQGFAEPVYGKKVKEATGLYRTGFAVPADWKGNPVYITFDGVSFGYTVWVNGRYVGDYAGSFNRHTFDISAFVLPGKQNILALKVITHPKGWEFDTNDDWALSGIIRDVTLFSLPPLHVQDVVVKTFVRRDEAVISIKAPVEQSLTPGVTANAVLTGRLLDASGRLVKEFALSAKEAAAGNTVTDFEGQLNIQNPRLWTAETPYLYRLQLVLKNKATVIQQYTDRIGIREITWADGVLKLNGRSVKLKGATHHDLSPVNGRSVTRAEMLQDLILMRRANINFLRTSHYPPQPELLRLCDSMGFYVMDEVPYGFGEEHLKDSSYLPLLLQRARATIDRDKNRPCIIIWSVGNENPVTDIGLQTGRYVKMLDNTRPYCFPQTPTDFEKMLPAIPDSLDILDDHYPDTAHLRKYLSRLDRPMVASEYAHALGLDFNSMEAIYEMMYAYPKLAGGAVWEFFDQGILRKAPKNITKGAPTPYVWATADSIYDTGETQGTDGVVYANRVPQVDYWQVRKVYTPVKASDDTFLYRPGQQTFQVRLENRYDFTNLAAVKGKWQLMADTTVINTGILSFNCAPHDTQAVTIHAVLPDKPSACFYYLQLQLEDGSHYQFYEKTYVLQQPEYRSLLSRMGRITQAAPVKKDSVIAAGNYRLELCTPAGGIQLKTGKGELLIAEGPYARTGRKPSMAQEATTTSRRSKVRHTLWSPFLLKDGNAETKLFNDHQLVTGYHYRPDSLPQRSLSGDIAYRFSDSGFIRVNYRLTPEGKEEAVETGISFIIPASYTEFRWIGKGPYEAYPGKDRLSEFGFYHLSSNDLYFAGNRQQVSCAVFSNAQGEGFALLADDADIAVERSAAGIIISHNAHVSGRFNKYEWPEDLFLLNSGKEIKGSFVIVPFSSQTCPAVLIDLFGDIKTAAKPFQPFYYSYDQ